MTPAPTTIRTTGVWEVRVDADRAVLSRPATDDVMTLEDLDPTTARAVFAELGRGCSPARALELLSYLDEEPESALALLEEHDVVRRAARTPVEPTAGENALAAAMQMSAAEHGWRLDPTLYVFSAGRWREAASRPQAGGSVATALGATLVVARGCAGCLVLRTLGRLLEPGASADSLLAAGGAVPSALVAELLMNLERSPLREGEGLWVSAGQVARGWLLPHPDCVVPHGRPDRSEETVREGLSKIAATPAAPSVRRWAVEALVESPFAPARLHQVEEDEAGAPLQVPFIWGDTRLVRERGACVSVSIDGIIHGAGRSAEECRTISMSEAVERLGAQSAVPDGELAGSGGPFCDGYDLVRERSCPVPFDRVAVGLAREHLGATGSRERTFTGTASHVSMAEAVVHATQEIVKRDAFMVSWYRRRRLRRLTPLEPGDDETASQLAYLGSLGFRVEFFDLTMDLPMPQVLLRLTATRELKNFPAGGALLVPAAGFNPREAVHHTLKLACMRVFSLCHPRADELRPGDPEMVARIARRVPFWPLMARYLDPRSAPAHAFLGAGSVDWSHLPAAPDESTALRLARLREWFRSRDVPWMVVRLTDVVASGLGFEVVKVVMPSLAPLTLTRDEATRCARLRLPLQDAALSSLNPDPHPLY